MFFPFNCLFYTYGHGLLPPVWTPYWKNHDGMNCIIDNYVSALSLSFICGLLFKVSVKADDYYFDSNNVTESNQATPF